MNVGLASLYCLYVIASQATFSIGWFIFWLFFGLIIMTSIFCIAILVLFSTEVFSLGIFDAWDGCKKYIKGVYNYVIDRINSISIHF